MRPKTRNCIAVPPTGRRLCKVERRLLNPDICRRDDWPAIPDFGLLKAARGGRVSFRLFLGTFNKFVYGNVGVSRHDSRAAPQILQTASPVCGTKNLSSVRLYSAPQLHCTIVAIPGICASDRQFSSRNSATIELPLPTRQRLQTNSARCLRSSRWTEESSFRVKPRRTQRGKCLSELCLRADTAQYSPHVSKVPMGDIAWFGLI